MADLVEEYQITNFESTTHFMLMGSMKYVVVGVRIFVTLIWSIHRIVGMFYGFQISKVLGLSTVTPVRLQFGHLASPP